MTTFKSGWYVIYTKFRHEKKVEQRLVELKINSFLPTARTLKYFKSSKRYVRMPLFPSYIFVKLECFQDYFDGMKIPGVLYFLKLGDQVAEIKESVIRKLEAIISNSFENIDVLSGEFTQGAMLNVHTGPFKGCCCEIIEHKGKNKILVRLELLNRNVLVELPSYFFDSRIY
jgi:transcriptional antiterminator RfaH